MKRTLTILFAMLAMLIVPNAASAACNVGINETVAIAPPATVTLGGTQTQNYSVTACTVTDHVTVEWVHVTDPTRPFMLNPANRTTVHAETSHGTAMSGSETWTVPANAATGQYAIITRYYAVGGNGPEAQAAVSFFVSSPPTDVCTNIAGAQTTVPAGMTADNAGNCTTPPVDVCANIAGVQTSVPAGMVTDGTNCVVPPVDVCANIAGVQTTVPAGMTLDSSGNCTTPPTDVCANIDGVQTTVPAGMTQAGNTCITPPVDVCVNTDGVQTSVPTGMLLDAAGNCTTPPVDVCANIDGVQTTVPAGMAVDASGNCATPPVDVCPNVDGVQVTVPLGFTLVAGTCTIIATPTGTPTPLHARLGVTKTANVKKTKAGGTITYTLVVKNFGPDDALNVKLCDKLPSGTTYISANGTAYFSHGSVCWNITRLDVNKTFSTKLKLRVNTTYRPKQVANTACAKGDDTNRACGTARVTITHVAPKPHHAGVTG